MFSLMDQRISIWLVLMLHFGKSCCTYAMLPADNFVGSQAVCNFGEKQCTIQCEARRFNKGICDVDFCHCVRHISIISRAEPTRCFQNCENTCRHQYGTESGTCDIGGTCFCHDSDDLMTIAPNQCVVPKKFCQNQCRTKYFEESSCVDELCLCASGLRGSNRRFRVLDFASDFCPVPRAYCTFRCQLAKFKFGSCFESQCVCSKAMYGSQEDYFLLNLKVDDPNCDQCKKYCTTRPMRTGRCIANQCVCMNLEDFEVGPSEPNPLCEIPIEYCMRICSTSKYTDNAVCKPNLVCLCAKGLKNKKFDFRKGPCLVAEEACDSVCSQLSGGQWQGFCSEQHCLCFGQHTTGDEGGSFQKFGCMKSPPDPYFKSVCYVL